MSILVRKSVNLLRRVKRRIIRTWHSLTGQDVVCNMCGWRGEQMESDNWHPHTICPGCKSQVRHRLLVAALTHIEPLSFERLVRGKTVLQFAPEEALRLLLLKYAGRYLSADYLADGYTYKIDLQLDMAAMPQVQNEQIDLLVACDVLEHIPDHLAALGEIYRVLKTGGWVVLTVPQKDNLETTFEDPSVVMPEDRERVFGQFDHLRVYGNDFPDMLKAAGFQVKQICETDFSPRVVRKNVLFPPILSTHPLATNYRKIFFAHKVA
jgi:SAM-dependent methyltransferase